MLFVWWVRECVCVRALPRSQRASLTHTHKKQISRKRKNMNLCNFETFANQCACADGVDGADERRRR
jgi:hypothetical protein